MAAYVFYLSDEIGKKDCIGILAERRKNPRKNKKGLCLELGMEGYGR